MAMSVRGFVLGQMTRCGTDDERGPREMFAEVLAPLGVPVVAGLPIGHGPTSRPVVLGGTASLSTRTLSAFSRFVSS